MRISFKLFYVIEKKIICPLKKIFSVLRNTLLIQKSAAKHCKYLSKINNEKIVEKLKILQKHAISSFIK